MRLRSVFESSESPTSLGQRFRERRFGEFRDALGLLGRDELSILDVGGTEAFWRNQGMAATPGLSVTLVNLRAPEVTLPGFTGVAGDACDLSAFDDDQFDVVFSNSVIEHLETWDNQRRMAAECRRVGRHYFVQTPNRRFPVEAHFLLPWFQYLPKDWQVAVLTRTPLSRGKRRTPDSARRAVGQLRLLDRADMAALFPGATISEERVAGLVKSFTAHDLPRP